ncbi:MAG TPA: regulatory protein RecX [Spirochaetales bacterium]|nr:regulatory protein RecX [Spirochaetales bacterium]
MATSEADKNRAKAKNYAYTLLRNRPRSEKELRERLRLKGFDDATVDIVIADLTKAGYVNDAKFAKFLVESRMHANPVGDVILKHQLKMKGVSDEVIEGALVEKDKSYDEYELALAMAKERFERLKKFDRRKATKRVYDFMLRRGFKYDTIRRVIDEIIQTHDDNE